MTKHDRSTSSGHDRGKNRNTDRSVRQRAQGPSSTSSDTTSPEVQFVRVSNSSSDRHTGNNRSRSTRRSLCLSSSSSSSTGDVPQNPSTRSARLVSRRINRSASQRSHYCWLCRFVVTVTYNDSTGEASCDVCGGSFCEVVPVSEVSGIPDVEFEEDDHDELIIASGVGDRSNRNRTPLFNRFFSQFVSPSDMELIMGQAGDSELMRGTRIASRRPAGDYVESNSRFNSVLAHFLENATPRVSTPASKEALSKLQRIKVCDENLKDHTGECVVCKDDITNDVEIHSLPCKHDFHVGCIMPWLNAHNTCPVCRYEFPVEDSVKSSSATSRSETDTLDAHIIIPLDNENNAPLSSSTSSSFGAVIRRVGDQNRLLQRQQRQQRHTRSRVFRQSPGRTVIQPVFSVSTSPLSPGLITSRRRELNDNTDWMFLDL